MDTWGRASWEEETADAKGCEVGTHLACSLNSREASAVGVEGTKVVEDELREATRGRSDHLGENRVL